LRIISGEYKARIIPVPRSFKARPTTDTAKESLFNILANYFDFNQLKILDLFSGTGSIAFEFASRGASKVTLVEINKRYTDFINQTIARLGFKQMQVIRSDAFRYIRNTPGRFDIIFADPPYDMPGIETLPEEIFKYGLLAAEGWFILEHGRNNDFSDHSCFRELRKYGSVHFSIFVSRES
jgi:16S rRNA (guanine(966)-N(2))-methyltransferase RsmD